jgi:hypothetical protein
MPHILLEFVSNQSAGRPTLKAQEIQRVVRTLQRDLHHFGPRLGRTVPDFSSRFSPILRSFSKPFRVAKLATAAAFEVGPKRQLTFNSAAFRMFHKPINRMQRLGQIPHDMAVIARQIAIEQLVVHELTHVSVGLVHFADVQALKGLVGVNALGELDLIADASAARICARLEMFRADERGAPNYASRLLQQLYVMGRFAFPAFGAPADKLHKRQRFLGLAMMAARVDDFLRREESCKLLEGEFPIDTAVYPYVNLADGIILISAFAPDRVLWGGEAHVDQQFLVSTCDDLDSVPFEVSVDRAAKILRQIGRLTWASEAGQQGAIPDVQIAVQTG